MPPAHTPTSARRDAGRASRIRSFTLIAAVACAGALIGAPVAVADRAAPATPDQPSAAAGRLIVTFEDGVSQSRKRDVIESANASPEQRLSSIDGYLVRVDPDQGVRAAQRQLEASPAVDYAEPDYRLSVARVPNDPLFEQLDGLDNSGQMGGVSDADIDAPEAWDGTTGGNVTVAVVDSGIDMTHPDLSGNLWTNPGEKPGNGVDDDHDGIVDDVHGANFRTGTGNPTDDNGHGTLVSGVIAAQGNNGKGVVGVAWKAHLMALKFLDQNGNGYTSDAVLAIDYARTHGARVINASWAGPGYSQALRDAIARAGASGTLFVTAAGNDGRNIDTQPVYPAAYPDPTMVTVAATDDSDELADYSNYGRTGVDLAAPGSDITSTYPGGYGSASGTSLATPFVAGTAALLAAQSPGLDAQQLRNKLMAGVDRKPGLTGAVASGGRLNAAGALGMPAGNPSKHDAKAPHGRISARRAYQLRFLLRHGASVRCATDERATCAITVRQRGSGLVLGKANAKLSGAGARTVAVRLTRKAARKLRGSHARRISISISATLTDASGNASSARR